jgi:hypothetical protein
MAEQLIFKCEHFICKIAIDRVLLRTGCSTNQHLGSYLGWLAVDFAFFLAKGVAVLQGIAHCANQGVVQPHCGKWSNLVSIPP